MAKGKAFTISQVLRATITARDESHASLERATGVRRASIARFVSGERTLRLDMADKLALHFGLELRRRKAR
jgi:plasmid maintenance system antidote protein VapI